MTPDHITLVVLAIASVMTLNHARATLRNRSGAGASALSTLFFTAMAAWNAFYFGLLAQWYACAGSVLLFVAHAAWLALLWRFRRGDSSNCQYVRII